MNINKYINYNPKNITVQIPHNGYIDRLMRMDSFPVLWELFKSTDKPSKEMSESFSALIHMRRVCKVSEYNWLHIGDGSRARTAALFSMMSKSINLSIDPLIKLNLLTKWIKKWDIKRFVAFKGNYQNVAIQNLMATNFNTRKDYNITCVHAHVNIEEVDKLYPYWKYLYSSVYLKKQKFSEDYMKANNIKKIIHELDLGITSDKREIVVYKKMNKLEYFYYNNKNNKETMEDFIRRTITGNTLKMSDELGYDNILDLETDLHYALNYNDYEYKT